MYIELPGASSLGSSDEWASRLFQIAGLVRRGAVLYGRKAGCGYEEEAGQSLGKKEAMQELGKGMAVDLFLGNRDRFSLTLDPEFGDDWFLNVDNFFLTRQRARLYLWISGTRTVI